MGQKNAKGSVSISKSENRIRLRWRFKGKRYSINLFQFSKANLIEARKIAIVIESDMLHGTFDLRLVKYKTNSHQFSEERVERSAMVDQFNYWATYYKNIDLRTNSHYVATSNMLKRWGNISSEQIFSRLALATLSPGTYNKRLRILQDFFGWALREKIVSHNPLQDVKPRKVSKKAVVQRQPFTEQEIQRVLNAFKNDTYSKHPCYRHSYYYPFMYFFFSTGVRNAEAVGLRVSHLDFDKGLVTISEVLARTLSGTHASARIRKETKNGKIRQIPMSEGLKEVLQKCVGGKGVDELVFQSHKGFAIDDRMFQRRVFKPILKELGLEDRDLYACRHTFGSRCIEAGLTPVMTAFLMGNNPETALRNYTHQISLPKELPKI